MKLLAVLPLLLLSATAALSQQQPGGQSTNPLDELNYRRPSAGPPPFKINYFQGVWKFDWIAPDSIFGSGGDVSGTEDVQCNPDGLTCEGSIRAETPDGPYTQQVRLRYDESTQMLTCDETDSRGFRVHQVGHVSSDTGIYLISYASDRFTFHGKVVRLKSTASVTAPTAYSVRIQISLDDSDFENLGNPRWRKSAAP